MINLHQLLSIASSGRILTFLTLYSQEKVLPYVTFSFYLKFHTHECAQTSPPSKGNRKPLCAGYGSGRHNYIHFFFY